MIKNIVTIKSYLLTISVGEQRLSQVESLSSVVWVKICESGSAILAVGQ